MSYWMDGIEYIQGEVDYRKRCSIAFKKHSYGNGNRNKRFRVLCNRNRRADKQGLLSTIFVLLPDIIEARNHGYTPVIDLCKNTRCQVFLQEKKLAKKENAWEYYFTQPDREITLNDVHQSRYVEEQIKNVCNPKYYIGDKFLQWNNEVQFLSLAIRRNIHLQQRIRYRIIHEKNKLFPKNNRILGVGIRAGYRSGILRNASLYNAHPEVGSCREYIENIEKRLVKWNYNSFFLHIDDREYLEKIKEYFGNSCIYLERPRFHFFQDALQDVCDEPDNFFVELKNYSVRQRNEDYLVELYLLAQCDSLYASRGTGHNFSYLLNNQKYCHAEIVDLGEFHYKK